MRYSGLVRHASKFIHLPDGHTKHFSFLVKRRNIVGFGYNKTWTTHPIAMQYGYRFDSLHSELDCILSFNGAIRELYKYTLVNIRFMADGTLGMSKPCRICQRLLKNYGIRDVFYTDENGEFKKL